MFLREKDRQTDRQPDGSLAGRQTEKRTDKQSEKSFSRNSSFSSLRRSRTSPDPSSFSSSSSWTRFFSFSLNLRLGRRKRDGDSAGSAVLGMPSNAPADAPSSDGEIVLALQALVSFELFPKEYRAPGGGGSGGGERQWEMLLRVVNDAAVRYLDDSNRDIRNAAVLTCISVLDKIISAVERGSASMARYEK